MLIMFANKRYYYVFNYNAFVNDRAMQQAKIKLYFTNLYMCM